MRKLNEKKSIDAPNLWLIALAVCLVGLLWGASWYFIPRCLSTWQERGTFGDMFGAVNALFSGLAFAGVIIAVMLQSKELRLQREELEQTREELEGQKDQLTRQANYFEEQNFENKFFQMIKMHREFIKSINWTGAQGSFYFRDLNDFLRTELRKTLPVATSLMIASIERANCNMYKIHRFHLKNYFSNIQNLFDFVYSSKSDKKSFYVGILKSQLTEYELPVLFYYCQSKYGKTLHKYALEYTLFEKLDFDLLFYEQHLALYPRSVYGDREDGTVLDKLTFIDEPAFDHS